MKSTAPLYLPVDHLGIAARHLPPLLQAYTRLGFRVTRPDVLAARNAGGQLVELGQHSAHIIFADTYLELTAVPGALRGHHLEHYLKRFNGLHILALKTCDAAASHARLRQTPLPPLPLQRAARQVDYRIGDRGRAGEARFSWFQLAPEAFPEGLVCYVQHHTRDIVFQSAVMDHPNGAVGLAGCNIITSTPQAARERFEPLAGADGGELPVGFLSGCDHGGSLTAPDPSLFEMGFAVKDLEHTAQLLSDARVDCSRHGNRLWVPADSAGGCAVWFECAF